MISSYNGPGKVEVLIELIELSTLRKFDPIKNVDCTFISFQHFEVLYMCVIGPVRDHDCHTVKTRKCAILVEVYGNICHVDSRKV